MYGRKKATKVNFALVEGLPTMVRLLVTVLGKNDACSG